MKIIKAKSKQLKKILTAGKKLLIFNHNNPDPDSIASSLILSEIAKKLNVKSKVVYDGEISFSKNIALILYVKLNMIKYQVGMEKKFNLTAIVDAQKGMTNNCFPIDIFPDITFDHHPPVKQSNHKKNFIDIRTKYGSAASILLEYYLDLGFEITEHIATVFCFAIIAETNHFTRKSNSIDIKFYKQAIQDANLKEISKIENTKSPKIYFKVLNKALSTYKLNNNILHCTLGEINNIEFLHQIANFFLTMEKIEFIILTGKANNINKVCCRSTNSKIHLGNVLSASLENIGSGGGHENMAAGNFFVKEEKVISSFIYYLKKFINH